MQEVFGFLSYARADMDAYELDAFLNQLEIYVNERLRYHRFKVRYDRDIEHGKYYNHVIKDLIDQATIYLVALSSRFLFSKNCLSEYQSIKESSLSNDKRIYVLRLERPLSPEWKKKGGELVQDIFSRQFFDLPSPEARIIDGNHSTPTPEAAETFWKYTNELHRLSRQISLSIEPPPMPEPPGPPPPSVSKAWGSLCRSDSANGGVSCGDWSETAFALSLSAIWCWGGQRLSG